jgi:hypothetical protein
MNTRLAYRQWPSRTLRAPAGDPSSCLVNDVHSQLNATVAAGSRAEDDGRPRDQRSTGPHRVVARGTGRIVRGEFRREDPNGTRLFFGPTGRPLERGQVYLGVFEFMMPFVQVGITNPISVGGGTPLIFGWATSRRAPSGLRRKSS